MRSQSVFIKLAFENKFLFNRLHKAFGRPLETEFDIIKPNVSISYADKKQG